MSTSIYVKRPIKYILYDIYVLQELKGFFGKTIGREINFIYIMT